MLLCLMILFSKISHFFLFGKFWIFLKFFVKFLKRIKFHSANLGKKNMRSKMVKALKKTHALQEWQKKSLNYPLNKLCDAWWELISRYWVSNVFGLHIISIWIWQTKNKGPILLRCNLLCQYFGLRILKICSQTYNRNPNYQYIYFQKYFLI